jgi:hypothetical protein
MQIAVIEKITDFDLSHVARLVNRRKFAQLLAVVDEGRGGTWFHAPESFLPLPDQPMRPLGPRADVRALIG